LTKDATFDQDILMRRIREWVAEKNSGSAVSLV
jgi:hypothetical protein